MSTTENRGTVRRGVRGVRALLALGAVGAFTLAGMGTAQAQGTGAVAGATGQGGGARADAPGETRYPASVTAAQALRTELSRRDGAGVRARVVCYRTHVADFGWLGTACNGAPAGSAGYHKAVEAVEIATSDTGGVCANAHLADHGWQGTHCAGNGASVTVGTTGQSRRMEALWIQVGTGPLAAQGHVQDIGWTATQYGNPVVVGTTGQHRRLEAISVWV
ncbi:polysaccharide deacetylase [Streptomyces yaizuensis]|uniref:Polysaccharide deacetylase n=1 Tax=Streptomyces yaizuensis TaxID=2989713 RepID=A0ABQ5PB91_9ACTN|nr:polysaccharide deacetylase [Streptomyces sp. YSPA8]GLF99770.1 polysaccharide deacetylase [Streptomyces sp. YSPA8]